MTLPKVVLNGAQEYANEKDSDVVIYEEPSLDLGYDFMTEEAYQENGYSESDILYTVFPD